MRRTLNWVPKYGDPAVAAADPERPGRIVADHEEHLAFLQQHVAGALGVTHLHLGIDVEEQLRSVRQDHLALLARCRAVGEVRSERLVAPEQGGDEQRAEHEERRRQRPGQAPGRHRLGNIVQRRARQAVEFAPEPLHALERFAMARIGA
ncbi:hypothetical protein P4114_29800 [Pseudomonas aeruginosa]|nr:hypothetical protein [Pseudomonas aeruginosa]